jgi:putative ABC transport system ATP-binding protein
MAEKSIIRLENVTKHYTLGDNVIKALDGVSFSICEGDFISVMGPSGSGKTTLLDVLSTMLGPTGGSVFIEGVETNSMGNAALSEFRGRKIGFIFQSFNLLPKLNAIENVMAPMWINKVPKHERFERAKALLESVGLGDRLFNRPNQLSGGQSQRVAIARALAMDPMIIVADEPTGNLDSRSEEQIIGILSRLNKENGKTILLVTHEPEIGARFEKQLYMKDGLVWKTVGFEKCPATGKSTVRKKAASGSRRRGAVK